MEVRGVKMHYGTSGRWYQREAFKFLILGLSFALIFGVTYYLNQSFLERAAATEKILVARRDILPFQRLEEGDFLLAERPIFGLAGQEIVQLEAFLSQGPWYTGALGIGRGDVVLKSRLSQDEPGYRNIIELMDEGKKRMLAVETDLTRSCARHLYPGSLVDGFVFLSRRDAYGQEHEEIIGPMEDPFLASLLVFEQKNRGGSLLEINEQERVIGQDHLPAVVTLILGEEETERAKALIYYNEIGHIYFSPTGIDQDWKDKFDALG